MARGALGYLKLVRLPNVFSALADILAGFFIAHETLYRAGTEVRVYDFGKLGLLLGASASLYLAGMAFNDIADRKEDTRVRPERPIPSGDVTLSGAVGCALALLLAGLLCAWLCGEFSLKVAGVLALAILLYDFVCKQPSAAALLLPGPLALGICRASNMLLGMSAAAGIASALETNFLNSLWPPVIASGCFGAGVTAFSAQEETGRKTSALVLGWLFTLAAFAAATLGAWRLQDRTDWYLRPIVYVLFGLLLARLFERTRVLLREPTPASARALVLAGLKGYCPLDAALLLTYAGVAGLLPAAVVLLLLFPGAWLRRKLAQFEA